MRGYNIWLMKENTIFSIYLVNTKATYISYMPSCTFSKL